MLDMLDTERGQIVERRLEHETGEAQQWYAALPAPARVGIEATRVCAVVREPAGGTRARAVLLVLFSATCETVP